MPIFALANTAIPLSISDFYGITYEKVSLGIIVGLTLGKPLGIVGLSFIAVKLGLAKLPDELTWKNLIIVGVVAGIGFTMSIFIAELSFDGNPHYLKMAKLGVLTASLISSVVAAVIILLQPKKETISN